MQIPSMQLIYAKLPDRDIYFKWKKNKAMALLMWLKRQKRRKRQKGYYKSKHLQKSALKY